MLFGLSPSPDTGWEHHPNGMQSLRSISIFLCILANNRLVYMPCAEVTGFETSDYIIGFSAHHCTACLSAKLMTNLSVKFLERTLLKTIGETAPPEFHLENSTVVPVSFAENWRSSGLQEVHAWCTRFTYTCHSVKGGVTVEENENTEAE